MQWFNQFNLARGLAIAMLLAAGSTLFAAERSDAMFKASDGVNIHYITLGDGGSWVVLMHGFGDTAERMWFTTGIAPALAKNHRVLAVEARNHGKSDHPQERGAGRAEDVIEVMDHLKIAKAHMHGYSMGGGFVGRLLASNPDRFITAAFGGFGVPEADPELAAKAAAKDAEWKKAAGIEPTARGGRGAPGGAGRGGERGGGERGAAARGAGERGAGPPRATIDLTKVTIPVFAINGELDSPNVMTQRLSREVKNFKNVILPGKNHLTAIAVGGPMPPEYIEELTRFIDANDPK